MSGNRPKFDVVMVRKDGEDQTFEGYDGQERTSQFRKIGAVWERNGKLSMSLDVPLTAEDLQDCWFNLYEQKGAKQAQNGKKDSKPANKKVGPENKKTAPKPPAPPADDPFDGDDSADSLDD